MQINVLHMAHFVIRYGVEKQLLNYFDFVKKTPNDIKHHVCALRLSAEMREELQRLDIPFTVNRLWPWNLPAFSHFVKENNIHILHVYNQLRFPFRSRILPKLAGVPLVIEHERGMVWNTSTTPMMKLTNRLVAANICNSHAAQIMLEKKCGISAKVIYNGVVNPEETIEDEWQLKTHLRISPDTPIVGFVGRLNNPKGAEAFIRMIPLVCHAIPQAQFVVVGDGPMRDYLEQEAQDLGIAENVNFLGYQAGAFQLMKQMDVVIVPSFREAFGNVAVEAALAKKPVIASNVDGLAEVVVDGETGFLIDCNEPILSRLKGLNRLPEAVVDGRTHEIRPPFLPNTKMLAEKVIACLQDPQMAATLGNQAYVRANSVFSFERYCNDLDNLYRELVMANQF
ncbi:MAG: putative glycosyl transferase [Firmicutes bacterium]|nr:putative glycosyl transferase [Bacillota bacterium]